MYLWLRNTIVMKMESNFDRQELMVAVCVRECFQIHKCDCKLSINKLLREPDKQFE